MTSPRIGKDFDAWVFRYGTDTSGGPGFYIADTASFTRAEVIARMTKSTGWTWRQLRRRNGRAVRVEFVQVQT